ncbi:MAG: glycoside hydrolase 43 family protein [Verrucomicrobiota bacterium]
MSSTTTNLPTLSAGNFAWPWQPDLGDGSYRNPVIYADYSDPDVVRHGEDFYLVASSFNCTPGLPILHSRDLVNWTLINHALKNVPDPRYRDVQPGCGVWAPSIRFHAGKFWIFFPTPDEGIYVTTASHPGAAWSEPHLLQAGKGLIDPCPLWDDDGQAYLVHAYAHSRSGNKHIIRICPMAPDGSRLLGEGKIIYHNPERHPTMEGPKFLKKDGWYYVLAPAGGVETGWQVVLRSRHIYGPYEDKIVLEQGSTSVNGPHQGALVDSPTGDWWFIHFQDAGVSGRIIHLQPVQWQDGWPLMGNVEPGKVCEPVMQHRKPVLKKVPVALPQTTDEFNSPQLGLQWQWHANHQDSWHSLKARPGWLRLAAQPAAQGGLARTPNLLMQKFPARTFAVETLVDFAPQNPGDEAGLVVMGRSHAALVLRQGSEGPQLIFRAGETEQVLAESFGKSARLRVSVAEDGLCCFRFAGTDGAWTLVGEKFQAQKGVWIGAKVGVFAAQSKPAKDVHADFDYFRFSPPDSVHGG